jgi:FkbM family methyltransferase
VTFDESMRYEGYDLSADDVVIDAGGFEGDFAARIHAGYGSTVHVYEPVPEFFAGLMDRFRGDPKIWLHNQAVSDAQVRERPLRVNGNRTGFYEIEGTTIAVPTVDIADVVAGYAEVGLLKLNIEGEEFAVLTRLLDRGLAKKCRNIQVQFHRVVPAADEQRDALQARLAETHSPVYDFPFVWESWKRN